MHNQENDKTPRLDSKAELKAALADLLAATASSTISSLSNQKQGTVSSSSSSRASSSSSSSLSTATSVQTQTHQYYHQQQLQQLFVHPPDPSIRYHKQSRQDEEALLRSNEKQGISPNDENHLNQSRRNSFVVPSASASASAALCTSPSCSHRHSRLTPEVLLNIRLGNQYTLGSLTTTRCQNSCSSSCPASLATITATTTSSLESSYRKGIFNAQNAIRDIKLQAQRNVFRSERTEAISLSERDFRAKIEKEQAREFLEEIHCRFFRELLRHLEFVVEPKRRRHIDEEYRELMFGGDGFDDDGDDDDDDDHRNKQRDLHFPLLSQFQRQLRLLKIKQQLADLVQHNASSSSSSSPFSEFCLPRQQTYKQEAEEWSNLMQSFRRGFFSTLVVELRQREERERREIQSDFVQTCFIRLLPAFIGTKQLIAQSNLLERDFHFDRDSTIRIEELAERQQLLFRFQRETLEIVESEARSFIYSFADHPRSNNSGRDPGRTAEAAFAGAGFFLTSSNPLAADTVFCEDCEVGRSFVQLSFQFRESQVNNQLAAFVRQETEARLVLVDLENEEQNREMVEQWRIESIQVLAAIHEREIATFLREEFCVEKLDAAIVSLFFCLFNFQEFLFSVETCCRSRFIEDAEFSNRQRFCFCFQRRRVELEEGELRDKIFAASRFTLNGNDDDHDRQGLSLSHYCSSLFRAQVAELVRTEAEARLTIASRIFGIEYEIDFIQNELTPRWNENLSSIKSKLFHQQLSSLVESENDERDKIVRDEEFSFDLGFSSNAPLVSELDRVNKVFQRQIHMTRLEAKAKLHARPFVGFSLVERGSQESFSRRRTVFEPLIVDSMFVGGPAHRAGIELGDILISVAGKESTSLVQVRTQLARHGTVGSAIEFTLKRKKKTTTTTTKIKNPAAPNGTPAFASATTISTPRSSSSSSTTPRDSFFSRFVGESRSSSTCQQLDENQSTTKTGSSSTASSTTEESEIITAFVEVMTCDEEFNELVEKGMFFDLKLNQTEKIVLEEYQ